jgi:hypothetical protein
MKPSFLLVALALLAAPLQAQVVSASVVLRGGPSSGQVAIPAHPRRVIVVETVRHRHVKHWKRGYRPVTVYYVNGRYYDRLDRHRRGVRAVVVYERGGRYYHDCRHDH